MMFIIILFLLSDNIVDVICMLFHAWRDASTFNAWRNFTNSDQQIKRTKIAAKAVTGEASVG